MVATAKPGRGGGGLLLCCCHRSFPPRPLPCVKNGGGASFALVGVNQLTAGSFHLSSPMVEVECWMSVVGWTRHDSHGLR
jgi:hypothetical protein